MGLPHAKLKHATVWISPHIGSMHIRFDSIRSDSILFYSVRFYSILFDSLLLSAARDICDTGRSVGYIPVYGYIAVYGYIPVYAQATASLGTHRHAVWPRGHVPCVACVRHHSANAPKEGTAAIRRDMHTVACMSLACGDPMESSLPLVAVHV